MGVAVYVCKICERYFLNPKGIIKHKKREHPQEYIRYKALRKQEILRRQIANNLAHPEPNVEVSSLAESNKHVQQENLVDTTINNNNSHEEPVAPNSSSDKSSSSCGNKKITRSTSLEIQKDKNHDDIDDAKSTHSSNVNASESMSDEGEVRSPTKPPFKCLYCDKEFRTARTRESHQDDDHLLQKLKMINQKTATNRRLEEQRRKQAEAELKKKQEENRKRRALAREQALNRQRQKSSKKENQDANKMETNHNSVQGESKTSIDSNNKKPPINKSSLFKCNFCPIQFRNVERLEIHQRRHKRVRKQKQQKQRREERKAKEKAKEGITATTNYNANNHNNENKKTTTANHQCNFCNKYFSSDTFLQQHVNIHLNIEPYNCDRCSQTFATHMRRKRHIDKFHLPSSSFQLIKCKLCSFKFVDPEALEKHESTHNSENLLSSTPSSSALLKTSSSKTTKSTNSSSPNNNNMSSSPSNNPTSTTASNATTVDYTSSENLVLKKKVNGHIRYRCKECKKDFRSQLTCLSHARHHVHQYPYVCTFEGCKKAYSDKYGLARHSKTHSEIIQKLKNQKRGLSSTKSSSSKGYPCTNCNKELSSFREKYNHEKRCKQSGRDPPFSSNHLPSSSKIAKVSPLPTYSEEIKKRNEEIAHGTKKELNLVEGIYDAQGTRYHQCKLCTNPIKKFIKRLVAVEHLRSNHFDTEEDQKPLVCPYFGCGKRMRTIHGLRNHESVHTGIRKFKCAYCSNAFFNYSTRYQHQKICKLRTKDENPSSNDQIESDEQQETQSSSEVDLPRHYTQKVGVDGKIKHVCSYCPQVFDDRNSARIHVNKHIIEKPYPCDFKTTEGFCMKRFADKNTLRQHLYDHKNDGKFKCCFCKQISSRVSNLREHISRVHSKRTSYECELCNIFFTSYDERGKHQVVDHQAASTSNIEIEDLLPHPIRSSSPTPSSSSSRGGGGSKRGGENQHNQSEQTDSRNDSNSLNKQLKLSQSGSTTTITKPTAITKPITVQNKPTVTTPSHTTTPNTTTTTTTGPSSIPATATSKPLPTTSKTTTESATPQTENLSHPCKDCDQSFENNQKLYFHRKSSHSSTTTSPTKNRNNSGAGTSSNSVLNSGTTTSTSGNKSWSCSECCLLFASQTSLKDHEKSCRNSINPSNPNNTSLNNTSTSNIHLEIRRPHIPVSDSNRVTEPSNNASNPPSSKTQITDKLKKFVTKGVNSLGKVVFKCKLCPQSFSDVRECYSHIQTRHL